MNWPVGINPLPLKKWSNLHENFTQDLKDGASFELTVNDPAFLEKHTTFKEKYNKTTENIQWLIKYAIDNKIRLRAMGSGWSFSKVAVSEGGIINTKKLRLRASLTDSQVSQSYLASGRSSSDLLFVQCGNTIISINQLLEKERNPYKCLKVSGASNGQTIVGAFSTGTHGAALKIGAVSECVAGMHIVVGPDRHVWLERSSNPVTSPEFRNWLGAEVILDDDLFNSALVSFGSFGFIHSVLIEVEPKFLLEQRSSRIPYDNHLENAIKYGDFSGLASKMNYSKDEVDQLLYHFELAINPHDFRKNDSTKGVYMRTMFKQPFKSDYIPIDPHADGHTYGDDVLGMIQLVLDKATTFPGNMINMALIPKIVNALFNVGYNRPKSAWGTIGETFKNTMFRGKVFSAAFAFNRIDIPDVIDVLTSINNSIPFGGIIAMRFVKGTKATLGFTKFADSCVLELDGVDASNNHEFTQAFVNKIEQFNIPYTVHWGKINHILNAKRVRNMYGEHTVDKWLKHRSQLLSAETQDVFNNEFLKQCGLDASVEITA